MGRHLAAAVLAMVMLLVCAGPGTCEGAAHPGSRNAAEDLLLIVDFQNVYLPGSYWSCPGMPDAMRNTLAVLSAPNAPDYLMTAFIAPEEPEGRWALYNEEYSGINGDAFLSEFAEEIRPYATDGHMVFKSVYSSMECEEVQAAMEGKKAVVLTGVVAECCVLATLMDAIDMGYEVVYLYDGIAGTSEKDEQMILRLAGYFAPVHVTVMSCAEYIAAISGDAGDP